VYTTDDGDEPGLLMGMVGWARSMGFEILSGGNTHEAMFDPENRTLSSRGKVIQLDDEALQLMERVTKDNLKEVIAKRRELTSSFFIDEECGDPYCHMAVASNGTGLLPDQKNPIHPLVYWDELPSVLVPSEMGGINENERNVIDIPTIIRRKGDPPYGGSIFMVISCDNAFAMEKMRRKGFITNFDTTAGVLYRPYHLCGAETAMSILCAALLEIPTGSKEILPRVDIICTARRDMVAGEIIGPIGDSGWNRDFRCDLTPSLFLSSHSPIPFFMLEGNRLNQDIKKGTLITIDMVETPNDSTLWSLRFEQDKLFSDILKH
jgi:predicted homoserine dehydrogenase-like protein